MEKTAVNWLIEQLQAPCRGIPSDIIEQAKMMEKEQIIKFADDYADTVIRGSNKLAKEYYNER